MRDLNDFYYFYAVVFHEGFSAASRKIGVPKGTLSKAVARLEDRLQVRLLERSTRRLRMTDVGRMFYQQCETMLTSADAAEAVVARAFAEPRGIVRVSCHQALLQDLISSVLPAFIKAFPKVRVQVKVLNRRADLIEDEIDVALRARTALEGDASLIVRTLGRSRLVLAMSPALKEACGELVTVERLAELPTVSMVEEGDEDIWELVGPAGETRSIRHQPRLMCSNVDLLRAAAIDGIGVALLPEHTCRSAFISGELVRVLPAWNTHFGLVHAVFSSRKGLVPAVRALIDHLALEIPKLLSEADCPEGNRGRAAM